MPNHFLDQSRVHLVLSLACNLSCPCRSRQYAKKKLPDASHAQALVLRTCAPDGQQTRAEITSVTLQSERA